MGLLSLVVLAGCASNAGIGGRSQLALVNGEPITLDGIRQTFTSKHGDVLLIMRGEKGLMNYVEKAITYELLAQEASRLGLDEDEELRRNVENFKLEKAKKKLQMEVMEGAEKPEQGHEKLKAFMDGLRDAYQVELHKEAIPALLEEGKEGAAGAKALSPEIPIAKIGGEEITLDQFKQKVSLAMMARIDRDKAVEMLGKQLETLVNERLLEKEAVKRGYTEQEEIVAEAEAFKAGIMVDKLFAEYMTASLEVTEKEMEQYYADHAQDFTQPASISLSHIVLNTREEAEEVVARIKNGEEFERLAFDLSTHKSGKQTLGRVGWVSMKKLNDAFKEATATLKQGEVSGVIEIKTGFHVVRVEGRREEQVLPFADVKNMVHAKLMEEKQRERGKHWVDTLRAKSEVVIKEEKIAEVQKAINDGAIK